MLSRLALRNVQALSVAARGAQALSTTASNRPVRLIDPSPVRYGFIPDEWFTFFYPKTGVSGPYMFAIGVSTYLVSKEFYVIEHEFYAGLSMLTIGIYVYQKFGDTIAKYLDKNVDDYEAQWESAKTNNIKFLEDSIESEKSEQWKAEGQLLLLEAKKLNIKLQLEAIYRERLAKVYEEVKKRLDYQVQLQSVERRIAQRHMANWIISSVIKSITPDQEKAALNQCVKDLEALASARA
ncbi:ATP synthase subunit b, mitochondrial isoform X2 [Orussus abietinus]|uniref:ATP synthase subunit b, mitochondrial isoform X2 n=1 Tax=Orussus abietinus TaxID=222816 RepID=UPI000625C723|nr:ATP synthase subunit b, mitochondrial isoform X2 [Orussus abietinus]